MKAPKIIILTGPVHSGKSAALMQWLKHRPEGRPVAGFVTPTIHGRKVFFDVANNRYTPYELETPSVKSIPIGKYFLDKKAFETASQIVENALQNPSPCFVLDEIGKLELNRGGHYNILLQLLEQWPNQLLLVVRDSLLQEVKAFFSLENSKVISKCELATSQFMSLIIHH